MEHLIERFVQKTDEIQSFVSKRDFESAKTKYHDLVSIYNSIALSDLEHQHKELAHEQLSAVHAELTSSEKSLHIPINVIVAVALIVIFGSVVAFNPAIIGLITFEDQITQSLNMTFVESTVTSVNLKAAPLSLAVTGEFEGDVKLFYKHGEELTLIFDSANVEGSTFENVCEDSCNLKADSNVVELFAQISDGSYLLLKNVIYSIPRDDNSAPVWVGKTKQFDVKGKLALNLDDYFTDPDGDDLVYLSTSDAGLRVSVANNIVSIIGDEPGEKRITVIASDLDKLTKVPLQLTVK